MKKILYFLRDYKKESILAPLFKMLEAIFELIVPLVMAAIIDVPGYDRAWGDRAGMLDHGSVFCRKGGCRHGDKAAPFGFFSYSKSVLF